MGDDATQIPPGKDEPHQPIGVLPEQTLDEMADAVRPAGVEVEAWRDEAIEAITQLCVPEKEIKPSLAFFFASAVLFYIPLGLFFHDWLLAAEIMAILYVHESGHYLAMKAFGYRDIQMFYIPLFGAAVSGRKGNATQVERALIALAGPAPSALVASIFLYLGWNHRIIGAPDNLYYLAYWTMLLNAPQLLPFEPLDGGHFFNAVVFSRHPKMETACKVIAAIAFLLVGLKVNSWVLLGIGAMAFFTLGVRHRMSLLGWRLRDAGLNTEAGLDEMPLDRMIKAYALARDLIPDSQAENMPRRVALRVGLLQRAYPSALARPASLEAVLPLLLVYFLVLGSSLAAWCSRPSAQTPPTIPPQEETNSEERKMPRIHMLEN